MENRSEGIDRKHIPRSQKRGADAVSCEVHQIKLIRFCAFLPSIRINSRVNVDAIPLKWSRITTAKGNRGGPLFSGREQKNTCSV